MQTDNTTSCPEADALIGVTTALDHSVVEKITHIHGCAYCREVLVELEVVRLALRPATVSTREAAAYEHAALTADLAGRNAAIQKNALPDLLLAGVVFAITTGAAVLLFGNFFQTGNTPPDPVNALPIAAPAGLLVAWESWRRDRSVH